MWRLEIQSTTLGLVGHQKSDVLSSAAQPVKKILGTWFFSRNSHKMIWLGFLLGWHCDQKQPWKDRVDFILQLSVYPVGTQGRNGSSPAFLYRPRPQAQGPLSPMSWLLSHPSSIKKMPTIDLPTGRWGGSIFSFDNPLLRDARACQVDQNLTGDTRLFCVSARAPTVSPQDSTS